MQELVRQLSLIFAMHYLFSDEWVEVDLHSQKVMIENVQVNIRAAFSFRLSHTEIRLGIEPIAQANYEVRLSKPFSDVTRMTT